MPNKGPCQRKKKTRWSNRTAAADINWWHWQYNAKLREETKQSEGPGCGSVDRCVKYYIKHVCQGVNNPTNQQNLAFPMKDNVN